MDLTKEEKKLLLKIHKNGFSRIYAADNRQCRLIDRLESNEFRLLDVIKEPIPESMTICNGLPCCDENTRYTITASLTRKGILSVENIAAKRDKRRRDARKQKRDYRHDWAVSVVSALIGSALTLLIEHFASILSFVRGLLS